MTLDTWHSKFQLSSSYGLGVMMFWRSGGKGSLDQLMSDGGNCRTARATPGLLTTWWDVLRAAFCNLDKFLLDTVSGPLWNLARRNFGGGAVHLSRTLEADCHADCWCSIHSIISSELGKGHCNGGSSQLVRSKRAIPWEKWWGGQGYHSEPNSIRDGLRKHYFRVVLNWKPVK